METNIDPENERDKLFFLSWDLNSDNYRNQISFIWKHNEIRIGIHLFCDPPCREKCIHFDFFINGEHTLFKYNYTCYKRLATGKLPELEIEHFKLTFHVTHKLFEVYEEEKFESEDDEEGPGTFFDEKKESMWFPIIGVYKPGMRYRSPFRTPGIKVWVRKAFLYQYSPKVPMFKYEFFSEDLSFLPPREGNFTCHQIIDQGKSAGCGTYPFIGCEISDGTGEYRKYYWVRDGLEEKPILEFMVFFKSLSVFHDWKDYDMYRKICKSCGITVEEIERLLCKEISDLGMIMETD